MPERSSREVENHYNYCDAGAAYIHLDKDELCSIDTELDSMEMSEVFSGSPILKNSGFLR